MNESIASLIKDMSLDGVMQVIALIQKRPDIYSVIVTTDQDLNQMDSHFRELAERIENERTA